MHRYGDQAAFVATGGYHHHVGLNTWMSSGAPLAPANAAGLDRVVFATDGEARESEDPDGIRVALDAVNLRAADLRRPSPAPARLRSCPTPRSCARWRSSTSWSSTTPAGSRWRTPSPPSDPTPRPSDAGGRTWWGNCAWDGLGIAAALGLDAPTITSGGVTVDEAEWFHVAVPARHWWDDIGHT